MVQLSASSNLWSGVLIGETGRILTTSSNLGSAPIASFITATGATADAWVVGRDDDLDLAILEVISPGQTYSTVDIAVGDPLQQNEELVLLQYTGTGAVVDRKTARVIGSRQDLFTGIQYVQVQALRAAGADGGALIDNTGSLRGLRMSEQHMVDLVIGRPGEVWAVSAESLNNVIVPRLDSGISVINASSTTIASGAPPPIPAIFKGTVSAGGVPAAVGNRLYARVIGSSGSEAWFSELIANTGRFVLGISISNSRFNNARVEFWMSSGRAPITSTYVAGRTTELELVIP
jgi:hypothetical protein